MQRLHPNAILLFWLRFLWRFEPSGRKGRASQVFLTTVKIFLYFGFLSYILFVASRLMSGGFGYSDVEEDMSIFAWMQESSANASVINLFVGFVVILCILIGFSLLRGYLYYKNYSYQIGEHGLRVRKGVFSIHEAEVPYNKIQNIDIFRGILHRLLGLSNICIQTAGYSGGSEERHPGFVSEASIDGIRVEEAERLRRELLEKRSKA
jgi:uncharacterized membrane protein YdbT with pleckstrin-like domain